MIQNKNETLCWYCEKACGNCSWSKNFTPVEGWKADPTKVQETIDSFVVHECPKFELMKYIIAKLGRPGFTNREIKEAVAYYKRLLQEMEGEGKK